MLPALALGTKLTNEHRGSTLSLATLPEIKYTPMLSLRKQPWSWATRQRGQMVEWSKTLD